MIYYQTPLHVQTAFAHLGYQTDVFPVSIKTAARIFSLPMHAYLTATEQQRILAAIEQVAAS